MRWSDIERPPSVITMTNHWLSAVDYT